MKISIIIPAYQEEEPAAHVIHQLARHFQVFEVVVVAVRCSPAFNKILRKIQKIKFLEAPKRGRGAQMNFGAAASRGDLLLFLHADTQLEEGAIEEMAEKMRGSPYGGGFFPLRIKHPAFRYRFKEWGANFRSKVLGMPYGDQAYFVRRDVFKRMSGFKNWPLFEDVEFFNRFKTQGPWISLQSHALTSPRRWEKQGYWKATFKNALWIILYKLGVSPYWLAKHY